ncbi:Hypothetical protein CINCED_3A005285 [Cinara cedri]|uniref:HAT C-terminal dimerisation domain-containing protein n=1 Tax=Cinara cedri TaxID=506608 RepID=A0A5E4NM63_9HEMI|nr:Hypothetical protein CINCED_3A005285 [Cinara cedri]
MNCAIVDETTAVVMENLCILESNYDFSLNHLRKDNAKVKYAMYASFESIRSTCALFHEKKQNRPPDLSLANLLCRLSYRASESVAGNERSFTKLKLAKNHLRNSQENFKLNNLMLLSSEKDFVDRISLNEILCFIKRHKIL